MRPAFRARAALALGLIVAACGHPAVPPPRVLPAPPPVALPPRPTPSTPRPAVPTSSPTGKAPATAVAAGVVAGPAVGSLGLTPAQAFAALQAFASSCGRLQAREDLSGLTQRGDWAAACAAASGASEANALSILQAQFAPVQVGSGSTFITGYYEPEIAGSRTQAPGYAVPIYAKPSDLIEIDLGAFAPDLKGRHIDGRWAGTQFLPYFSRADIDAGALAGRGLEIAWAADTIELFFLQVQGSGRLRLPDGSVMRIGYAGQNGRPYVGIGGLMMKQGLVPPGQASMQGIMSLLRAMPDGGRATMEQDPSYVFFREITGAGPIGALGVAVTGRVSVAADPKFVPLGAPVFLSVDRPEANGLWVAQDTGGAIKGANRFDTFWGAGADARTTAGGMSARGSALLLLPVAAVQRLVAAGAPAQR